MAEEKVAFTLRVTRSSVKKATSDQVKQLGDELGFKMGQKDTETYTNLLNGYLEAVQRVDKLTDFVPKSPYPRTAGYKPDSTENPLNAWYVKTDVKGRPGGKLDGKTFALKDNVCMAGVAMMNGSAILEGYVPDVDATVVSRILDAGGTILGKAHCEDLCFSGGSHTCAAGPVHNPQKHGYSAGGSSSGSAALVGSGEVDMAIGGDQGGSIRIPSSYSGTYGMKPTFGLVPYSGIYAILHSIDHVGPITNNVRDNALFLEALAGPDGLDPRQGPVNVFPTNFSSSSPLPAAGHDYQTGIDEPIRGMKIGVVTEGFSGCKDNVIEAVKNAATVFQGLGAVVEEVSIPFHGLGADIWTAAGFCSATFDQCFQNGMGCGYKGLYVTSMMDHMTDAWKARSDRQSETGKIVCIASKYLEAKYGSKFHGKASNLTRKLTMEYDRALSEYDVLIMPTLPLVATKIPEDDAPTEEIIARGLEMIKNTCPFNLTGHPAMSIPCGKSESGLPIGLMIIGRKLHEKTIYNFAYNFEQNFDWKGYTTSC